MGDDCSTAAKNSTQTMLAHTVHSDAPVFESLVRGSVTGSPEESLCLAGRERTLCGHQNQRPRSAAMDGVMNERTTSVSNNRPRPMVVPTCPTTRGSLTIIRPQG